MATVPHRISNSSRALLITFAVIADTVQALIGLLWVTVILGIFAFGISLLVTLLVITTFSLFFISSGVSPFSGRGTLKKIAVFAGTTLAEVLPVFGNLIPSITIWTLMVIHQSRVEDKETAKRNATIERGREAKRLLKVRRLARRRANDNQEEGAEEKPRISRYAA